MEIRFGTACQGLISMVKEHMSRTFLHSVLRDPEILPHNLQDMREEQAEQSRRAAPPRQPNEAEEIRKGINVRNNIVNDYFS